MKILIIEGAAITDIPSFYAEINRVFMGDEDWRLGESLDALDDMLYGDYGAIKGKEPLRLIWRDYEKNRADLGLDTTRRYYQAKLDRPDLYRVHFIRQKLAALEDGTGETFFETVLTIIGDHPNIMLVAE